MIGLRPPPLGSQTEGLDPMDRALADAVVKRMRFVLLLHKRKGIVRLVGLQRARSARWGLIEG
jgi:hypothetical protein